MLLELEVDSIILSTMISWEIYGTHVSLNELFFYRKCVITTSKSTKNFLEQSITVLRCKHNVVDLMVRVLHLEKAYSWFRIDPTKWVKIKMTRWLARKDNQENIRMYEIPFGQKGRGRGGEWVMGRGLPIRYVKSLVILFKKKCFRYVDRSFTLYEVWQNNVKVCPRWKSCLTLRLHTKPFIIQVKKLKSLPFDVSDHRVLEWWWSGRLMK